MRKTVIAYGLSWGIGLLFMPTAQALRLAEPPKNDYRLPTYDKISFEAEASGEGRVSMSWDAFEGFNDEEFEYYKVIRSFANPNPLYPEQGAIAVKDQVGDTRFTDGKAYRSAYYRVCAITNAMGRHCSNVVWVEIEKSATPDCQNYSSTGKCEDQMKSNQKAKKEADAWQQKQTDAKKRLEERKGRMAMEKEKRQKEWEAKKSEKSDKKSYENDKKASQASAEEREKRIVELYEKMFDRLDQWLENFAEKLDQSNLDNTQKIERIEAVQKKFYAWEQGKEMRIKMVDHIDEGLNALKKEYSVGDDFAEIDDFLNGLLED